MFGGAAKAETEEEKTMKQIKKAFSVILTVCMTLMQMLWNGAFVLPAYADTGVSEYGLYVGGAPVTSENKDDLTGIDGVVSNNGGTASYDPGTNSLYLSGVDITGGYIAGITDDDGAAIFYTGSGDLNIIVEGDNTVTGIPIPNPSVSNFSISGIYSMSSVSITGSGHLDVKSADVVYSYGIFSFRNLNINCSGSVTATAGKAINSHGISCYDMNVSGGKVTAAGPAIPGGTAYSYGIYCTNAMTVSGGEVISSAEDTSNGNDSYGIYCRKIAVNGGSVEAKTTASGNRSRALSDAPALGSGVSAEGSTSSDGSGAVAYLHSDNRSYKWFKSLFTVPDTPAAYDLYVGGVQVTSVNAGDLTVIEGVEGAKGSACYDAENNTLHLDGVNITGGTGTDNIGGAIVYNGTEALNIEVTGANIVTGDSRYRISAALLIGDPFLWSASADPDVRLSITAGGSLTAAGGDTIGDTSGKTVSISAGIFHNSSGTFTIAGAGGLAAEGAKGVISSGFYGMGSLDIGGDVTVSAAGKQAERMSNGIRCLYNLTVSSGTVFASAEQARSNSYGINCQRINITGGTVEARTTSTDKNARALNKAPTLERRVTAKASTSTDGEGAVEYNTADNDSYVWFRSTPSTAPVYDLYDLYVGGVQVTSGNAGNLAAGNDNVNGTVQYDVSKNTLYLEDATITGAGGTDDHGGAIIYSGAEAFNIEVTGTNTVTGDPKNDVSAGILIGDPFNWMGDPSPEAMINIAAGGSLTVTGGTGTESSGIYHHSSGTFTITGDGDLAAEGVNARTSAGIMVYGDLVINCGGKVTAVGGQCGADGLSIGINSNILTINSGTAEARTTSTDKYSRALNWPPTFGADFTAQGSTETDGADAVKYDEKDNDSYKWFRSFPVRKLMPEITVTANDVEAGRWVYIDVTVPADASGELWLKIVPEEGYSKKSLRRAEYLRQGKWTEKTVLSAGTYTAAAEYAGDDRYEARNVSATFTVTEGDSSVKISANDIYYGEKETVTVTVPEGVTGKITLMYDSPRAVGKREINAESLSSGVWQVELENLPAETYTIVADYAGNQDDYAPSRAMTTFTVRAADSFLQDEAGWHYLEKGEPVKNDWRYISYNNASYWYYFNNDGVMQTGWLDWNGNRYYLNPRSDGWQGRMQTGWQFIDGNWYFFEPDEGKDQGRMYCSERNSEGYYLGTDGAWVAMP